MMYKLKITTHISANSFNCQTLDTVFQEPICVNSTSEIIQRLFSEFSDKNQDSTESSTTFHRQTDQESKSKLVKIKNDSGINLMVCPTESSQSDCHNYDDIQSNSSNAILLESGTDITIETGGDTLLTLAVVLDPKNTIGDFLPLLNLPSVSSGGEQIRRHDMIPKQDDITSKKIPLNMEPVLEYCVENQRIRSAFNDTSTLDDGVDLLSAQIWSPSDQILTRGYGNHWLHPYMDGDVNEWSDMSGSLRLSKEEAMLPDNKWVWANDWEVDVSGEYGVDIDADGFSYGEDFTKLKIRRFFKPGDTCRRRRWIR